MTTVNPLVGQVWLAQCGSKTDRCDAFRRILDMDPPDEVAELCRQGLDAATEPERSRICGELLAAVGDPSNVRSPAW